jgi:dTDP-4-amino-4,6-dideoxygalactose transaminase
MPTNNTLKLEREIEKLTLRTDAIAVGRAAWGLFALLSIWKTTNKSQKIALPSFLCQSILAATLLAEWEPEFCDVDLTTGNVSHSEWQRVLDLGIDAIFFVHLFGNVGDAAFVAEACKKKGIYFIEDACQSFGGSWNNMPVGTFGDASIISFGYTKLIDVGQGGMILTNDSGLANTVRNFKEYCRPMPNAFNISKKFKEMFYMARNQLVKDPILARKNFKGLISIYQPLISSVWKPELAEKILLQLKHLDTAILQRRVKNELFREALYGTALVPLSMSEGSVPWRSVFKIPDINWQEQEKISNAVRKKGVDISNWYIPSHWLMEDSVDPMVKVESTERLSKEIFQLWIDNSSNKKKVNQTAIVLRLILEEFGYA